MTLTEYNILITLLFAVLAGVVIALVGLVEIHNVIVKGKKAVAPARKGGRGLKQSKETP